MGNQTQRQRKYGTPDGVPVSRRRLRTAMATLADRTLEAHRIAPEVVKACLRDIRAIATSRDADPRTKKMANEFIVSHGWKVYEHEHPANVAPPPPPTPQKILVEIVAPGVPSQKFSSRGKFS
jgi:hypothetical protein